MTTRPAVAIVFFSLLPLLMGPDTALGYIENFDFFQIVFFYINEKKNMHSLRLYLALSEGGGGLGCNRVNNSYILIDY
jgi:hypothetical protein